MSLKHTMAAIPEGSTRRYFGTAYWNGVDWFANIGGSILACRWMDPIQPLQGGNIVVDITNEGRGQFGALVVGGYADQPRPSTGSVVTVIAAGVATEIVFTGADGETYTTDRFIGSYSPGDPVYVTWDAAQPTVIGKIGALAVTPSAPAPPAAAPVGNGSTTLTATATDTYWAPGGWGSYATSRNGGEDVYTGTWGGQTVIGAFFYGAPRPELAGKAATRIQFKVPARMDVGAHNDPVSIFVYGHTSGSRPGGDVSRIVGSYEIVIPAKWQGGLKDLPTTFGPAIADGGGISFAGGSYAGFISRLDDPEAGKLIMDWTA